MCYTETIHTGISLEESCVPHDAVPQFNLPDFVVKYCSDMKARYVQQSILPDSDWPPSLGGQFIRLALIKQQRSLHYHTPESVIKHQIDYTRGDYDKIIERKTKIELIKAFDRAFCDGGGEIVLRMLIDGAPGVGKTTLSRKVSSMWANGEILQRYWLVLLLHLREEAISKAKKIDEFFYHDDAKLQQRVAEYVKERSGDGVLIIFDGFDELSSYERSEKSLFLDMSRGGKPLHKCAVAITSRPYASRSLQELPSINRHIEVLGFTDEQVEVCIMKKIKDQEKAKELCTELKDRLDIASICQIPLNCSIVLYVYEQENYYLPRTLTELYELFILHGLKRFLKRTRNDGAARKLLTLKKLKNPHDTHFSYLCKLSFEGLKDDKLVFTRDELERVFPSEYQELDMDLPVLDLMTSAKSYSSRGAQDTYSFLHLTIQEFLAAFWIAQHLSDDDKLVFLQHNLTDSRFRMALLFLSGLTKLEFPGASTVFSEECWMKDRFHICHLTYEAGNHSLCKDISEKCCSSDNTKSFEKAPSRFNTLVVSNFIAHSNFRWKEFKIAPDEINIVHKVFSSETLCSATLIENTFVNKFSSENGKHSLLLLRFLDELPQLGRIHFVVDISGKSKKVHEVRDLEMIKNLNELFTGPFAVCNKYYCIELAKPSYRSSYTLQRDRIITQFSKTLSECLITNTSIKEVNLIGVLANHTKYILSSLNERDSVPNLERLVCDGFFFMDTRGEMVPFQEFCTTLETFVSHNPCTSLKELCLEIFLDRELDKNGIDTIMSALQQNTTLQKLTLTPEELLFERNHRTGLMELKCSEEYIQRLSLEPSVILKGSNTSLRRRLNRIVDPSPLPPVKRPRNANSPPSVPVSCLQVVSQSHQLEVTKYDTVQSVSLTSRPSLLESSIILESNSAGPSPSIVPTLSPELSKLFVSQSNRPTTTTTTTTTTITAPISASSHRQSPEPQSSPCLRRSLTGSSHSLRSLSSMGSDTAGCHTSSMLDQTVQQSVPHQQPSPTPSQLQLRQSPTLAAGAPISHLPYQHPRPPFSHGGSVIPSGRSDSGFLHLGHAIQPPDFGGMQPSQLTVQGIHTGNPPAQPPFNFPTSYQAPYNPYTCTCDLSPAFPPPQSPSGISLHVNVSPAERPRNNSSPLTMASDSVLTFPSQAHQPEINISSFSQSEVLRQCQPIKYSLNGPSQMQARPILPSGITSNATHVTYSSAMPHNLSVSQHHLSRMMPQPVSSQHLPQQHSLSPARSSGPSRRTYTIPPTGSDVGMVDCHASPSRELSLPQSSQQAVNPLLTPRQDFKHNTSSVAASHVPYGPHPSFIPHVHGGSIPAVSEFLPRSSHVTTHQPAMNSQYQEPTLAGTSYGAQPISLPLSGSATTSFKHNYSVSDQSMPHHFYPDPSGIQLPQLAGCNTFTPQQYQYAWSALNNAVLQHWPMTPFGYSQPDVATNYHQPVQQLSRDWMQPPHQQQMTTPSHPATSPSAMFTTNSFCWTSTPTTSNY